MVNALFIRKVTIGEVHVAPLSIYWRYFSHDPTFMLVPTCDYLFCSTSRLLLSAFSHARMVFPRSWSCMCFTSTTVCGSSTRRSVTSHVFHILLHAVHDRFATSFAHDNTTVPGTVCQRVFGAARDAAHPVTHPLTCLKDSTRCLPAVVHYLMLRLDQLDQLFISTTLKRCMACS